MAKHSDSGARLSDCVNLLAKECRFERMQHDVCALQHPHLPLRIYFRDAGTQGAFVYLGLRTTSYEFDGDRTDLHDVISVELAIFLRWRLPWCSPRLWDELNPATGSKSELYGRFLTFEQPSQSCFSLEPEGLERIEKILKGLHAFRYLLPFLNSWTCKCALDPAVPLYEWDSKVIQEWLPRVRLAVGGGDTPHMEQAHRRNPDWMYYRRIKPAISVFRNPTLADALKIMIDKPDPSWETVETEIGVFFSTDGAEHVIPMKLLRRAERILQQLPGESRETRPLFLPLENFCIAVGKDHVLSVNADCGAQLFRQLRESLRGEHERRTAILFRSSRVRLSDSIDDEVFEEMVTLLLQREPNVRWARKMGHARQPEGGRDILVNWDLPTLDVNVPSEKNEPTTVRRRVIVQCKAKQGAVGKSDARDLRDLLEHSEATGYFLAVSSHLTVGLIDHLLELSKTENYWVDWWTRLEIETRLARHLDIARRYPAFVQVQAEAGPRKPR